MNRKAKYNSAITRRLYREYYTTMTIFVVAYVFMVILAPTIYFTLDLNEITFFYAIVQIIKGSYFTLLLLPAIIGWVIITNIYIAKPFKYLDEVVAASQKLADFSLGSIVLSDEMKQVQDDMNSARERAMNSINQAKEAEQRKNDLIVYLAHDLKTPLTSVIGYLTLLHDEAQISPELREKYLSISLEKAEHLEDLINEFFEITRFNLSNITLECSRVNLTRMLEQLVYEFRPMFSDKNLKCDLRIAPDTMVRLDVGKMQRVFDNLLRNAVNYSFSNSTIHIVVEQANEHISIKFTNRGNTIPKEKLERIFEQFYRLDTARSSRSGGAGLGLAIAKEIVGLHKGVIIARSQDEVIEFQVILPVS